MKTIHFKINSNESIKQDERIYSSMFRYALERFYDRIEQSKIYHDCMNKFKMNSFITLCAVREANVIYKRCKDNDKKIIFGNLKKYINGLISKEEFKESKSRGLNVEGDRLKQGNRMFKINLENQSIIYKRSCKEHITLKIKEKLSSKRKNLLEKIYLNMVNCLSPVAFKIKNDNLYISYDESIVESYRKFKDLKQNRILGIDLNPNYIGLSILEFDSKDEFKIIHKRVFDLTELNEQLTNKVKFELQQIDNEILNLCKHYKVSKLAIEDLKFKKSNNFWSKKLNKLCKNKFRYGQIKQHLNTLCNIHGVEFIEVNACYSSFIGNFSYGSNTTPDMIAASIEIARRAYKKFSKEWFYPPIVTLERIKEVIGTQWKDELKLSYNSWKLFFNQIKKLKLKYRFQLDGSKAVLSQKYLKKKVFLYTFS